MIAFFVWLPGLANIIKYLFIFLKSISHLDLRLTDYELMSSFRQMFTTALFSALDACLIIFMRLIINSISTGNFCARTFAATSTFLATIHSNLKAFATLLLQFS